MDKLWNTIPDLENFFKDRKLPDEVQLNAYTKVIDANKFVEATLSELKDHFGKDYYIPAIERLHKFRAILIDGW